MSALKDLTGQKFGMLTVIALDKGDNERPMWVCKCDCGGEKLVTTSNLKTGKVKSCHYHRPPKHGACVGRKKHPEYGVWSTMKSRCRNPNNDRFDNYGARGIFYCPRWEKYENFIEDMGRRPSPELSLERRDNNGNYEKSNCYWGTQSEQSNNTTTNIFLEYKGERKTIRLWADYFNVDYKVFWRHIRVDNMSIDEAVKICKKGGLREIITYNGESLTATDWARKLKTYRQIFHSKKYVGMSKVQIIEILHKKVA